MSPAFRATGRRLVRLWSEGLVSRLTSESQFALLRILGSNLGVSAHLLQTTNGIFLLPVQDGTVLRHVAKEADWEKGIRRFLETALRHGGTFLDVGAHVGMFSCGMAKLQHVNVIAFEPVPGNYELLKLNSKLNDVASNLLLISEAVGDSNSRVRMRISDTNSGDNRIVNEKFQPTRDSFNSLPEIVDAAQCTLDTALRDVPLQFPVVLKVDVQGAEFSVLRGSRQVLRDTDTLVLEVALEDARGNRSLLSELFAILECHFRSAAFLDAQGNGAVKWTSLEEIKAWTYELASRAANREVNLVFRKASP